MHQRILSPQRLPVPPIPHRKSRPNGRLNWFIACESGVIGLDHIQQEALLGDTELSEGLVEVAGVQGRPVEVHDATGLVNTVRLQTGTQGGGLVDDNGLALDIVANSNLNHNVSPLIQNLFCCERKGAAMSRPLRPVITERP